MGRSQVLYNQKRGRGRGRGRSGGRQQGRGGGGGSTNTARRNSVVVPPQSVPETEIKPFADDQVEHLLSLGSATANAHALRGGAKDNEWTSATKSHLNPIALGAALHRGYSRTELLRLPSHVVSYVYGDESSVVSKTTTTLIDVTGMAELKVDDEDNCMEEQESGDDDEDDDCVVYLGTKQPDDQDNEDDLDGWLDSVIS